MKTIYTAICLLLIVHLYADMPGNKARPSFDIRVKGITENPDYLFYARMEFDDSARLLNDSSSIYVPGGYGAPAMVFIWAVNKQTKQPTDSFFFQVENIPTILHSNLAYWTIIYRKNKF